MKLKVNSPYQLLAAGLPGFSHSTTASLFAKFMDNGGQVRVGEDRVTVTLKKMETSLHY